ncbi:hypothetical protein PFFVO_03052 [Plasmodium falciparum Vietnam Oak-Knoll (FVO)]|uniref:S-antigen protein n=1 Tax=Plasmodium falciparum Vietnam Oak-Knoll (FVO) TaxID=1036723 RepID=A0A024V6K2_PLAFA|nr:hypothetical protein PFFVO_03052 [Plasmodium falciparum Vietnam Oak-Knoll (FVO)]
MNRILSVSFYLFFLYLYIYKTYGKVKNTDHELSNIYGIKYYLRNGLSDKKNGKGQKYQDLEEDENDDEEDSNSEESNNDEENKLIEDKGPNSDGDKGPNSDGEHSRSKNDNKKKKSKKNIINMFIGM